MFARFAAGPSILAAFAALALGAAPAEAQRLSISPTIGVYIPTSELVKASQGQEFKQEIALSVGGRLGITLSPRFGVETSVSYVPSNLRFTFDGTETDDRREPAARHRARHIPRDSDDQPGLAEPQRRRQHDPPGRGSVRGGRGQQRRGWCGGCYGRLPAGQHAQLLRGGRGLHLRLARRRHRLRWRRAGPRTTCRSPSDSGSPSDADGTLHPLPTNAPRITAGRFLGWHGTRC